MRMMYTLLSAALILSAGARAQGTIWSDDFDDRSSGWPDNSERAYLDMGIGMYADGKYQMTPIEDQTYGVMLAPRQASGADVEVQSRFFMYAGLGDGGAGLVCRFVDRRNFYAFVVVGAGAWKIVKISAGEGRVLAEGAVAQVVPGAVDTALSARCAGPRLSLALEGSPVGEAYDTDFSTGASGLFVGGTEMAGTHALFEDFSLQELSRETGAVP